MPRSAFLLGARFCTECLEGFICGGPSRRYSSRFCPISDCLWATLGFFVWEWPILGLVWLYLDTKVATAPMLKLTYLKGWIFALCPPWMMKQVTCRVPTYGIPLTHSPCSYTADMRQGKLLACVVFVKTLDRSHSVSNETYWGSCTSKGASALSLFFDCLSTKIEVSSPANWTPEFGLEFDPARPCLGCESCEPNRRDFEINTWSNRCFNVTTTLCVWICQLQGAFAMVATLQVLHVGRSCPPYSCALKSKSWVFLINSSQRIWKGQYHPWKRLDFIQSKEQRARKSKISCLPQLFQCHSVV